MSDREWEFDNMQMKHLHKDVPIAVSWPSDAPELQGEADEAFWFHDAAKALREMADQFDEMAKG
jgi:hypothetical protein